MTTSTLRLPAILTEKRKSTGKGLFARFYTALIEARMRAAVREIALRRHLLPEELLKKSGAAATVTPDGAYPSAREG
jgi:hypothetical protein